MYIQNRGEAEMNSICLSEDEKREVTDKSRATAQARAFKAMGIPFRLRFDGSLMVLRSDVLQGMVNSRPTEPDFSAIGGRS